MSLEDNFEKEEPFDVTDLFDSRAYRIRGLAFPLGGDYLYFYSSLKRGPDIPFAFWTYGMITPNLFKLSPNGVKKKDIPNILRAVNLRDEEIAMDLLFTSINIADRMDRVKNKITAMTPFVLNKDVVDIYGIEFNIEYMPEHIILPSGDSMRDKYSNEIFGRYIESFGDDYLDYWGE